jgi:hypothetical protein
MNAQRKLMIAIADAAKVLFARHEVVGFICVAGPNGMLETRALFDAPWFKAKLEENEDNEMIGLRLRHKATDPHQELVDTLGALSGIAEILTESGLALGAASRALDKELGATHTPLKKV